MENVTREMVEMDEPTNNFGNIVAYLPPGFCLLLTRRMRNLLPMVLNKVEYCSCETPSSFVAKSRPASFSLSFLLVNKDKQELSRGWDFDSSMLSLTPLAALMRIVKGGMIIC